MSLELYKQLPIVTRSYVTLAFLTTVGCALEVSGSKDVLVRGQAEAAGSLDELFDVQLARPAPQLVCYTPAVCCGQVATTELWYG